MGADWSELDIPAAPFDVAALAAALDEQRQARGLSWLGVAREVSRLDKRPGAVRPVNASTIKGLASHPVVEGDGVLQMLIWLGRSPESFVTGHPGADRDEAKLPVVEPPALVRFDVPGIHKKLEAQRALRALSWTGVAEEIGGPTTAANLSAMARQTRTTFPGVMRIARWLKVPCVTMTRIAQW